MPENKLHKNLLKKYLCVICAVLFSVSAVSCNYTTYTTSVKTTPVNKTIITLSWWGDSVRNKYYSDAINIFSKENPDIIVEKRSCDYKNYIIKLNADIDMDRAADVMATDYSTFYETLSKRENFYNLENVKELDYSNFSSPDLSVGKVGINQKGIPVSYTTLNFFYNKTLYMQYGLSLPQTWEDIFEAADTFRINGIYPLSFNEEGFWHACNAYNEQLTGRTLFDNRGNFTGTVEDFETMLEFYVKLIQQKVSKPAQDFCATDIENCKTAGVAAWISDTEKYCSESVKQGMDIQVGGMPTMGDLKKYGWYKKPTIIYCIKQSTRHSEEAGKLLNYILNSEEAAEKQGTDLGLPTSKSALETLAAKDMLTGTSYQASVKMQLNNAMKTMNPRLDNPENSKIFSDYCSKVLYGKRTPKDAAEEMYREMKEFYNDI